MQSLPNGLYAARLDIEKIRQIWDDTTIKITLGLEDFSDFRKWISLPETVVFECLYGYIIFYNMVAEDKCEMVVSFYDKQLSKHTELVREAIRWIQTNLKVKRIAVVLPAYAHAVLRWCRSKLGFVREGTLRAYKNGKPYIVMSITEGEV